MKKVFSILGYVAIGVAVIIISIVLMSAMWEQAFILRWLLGLFGLGK